MICVSCEESLGVAADVCSSCGADPILDGRFRLESVLGTGAMGVVYRATELANGSPVAVKATPFPRDADASLTKLVEREARVLRQLSHPSIPTFHGQVIAGQGRGRTLYLVQELVDGLTLADELETHRYSEAEVLEILAEIADTLAYLHSLSPPVVHRDLKPSNIVRRAAGGGLALIDFGSVRDVVRDARVGGSTVAGTFGFMAPEQFRGDAEPVTDIWGLAAVGLALLSRRDPAELHDRLGNFVWRPHVRLSAGATALLAEMLDADPTQRPRSARDVARRCRALATAEVPATARTARSPEALPPRPTAFAEAPPAPEVQFFEPPILRKEAPVQRSYTKVGGLIAGGAAALALLLVLALAGVVTVWALSSSPAPTPAPVTAPPVLTPAPPVEDAPITEFTECDWSAPDLDYEGEPAEIEAVRRQAPKMPPDHTWPEGTSLRCQTRFVVGQDGVPEGARVGDYDDSDCPLSFRESTCEAAQGWRFTSSPVTTHRQRVIIFTFRRKGNQ